MNGIRMKTTGITVVAIVATLGFICVAGAAVVSLNDTYAVRENGLIVCYGTKTGALGVTNLFDGIVARDNYLEDVHKAVCWGGYELSTPCVVTEIRYVGRSAGWLCRMKGVLFQGANTADFSDAQTLAVAQPPYTPTTNGQWITQYTLVPAATNAFKYLRLYSTYMDASRNLLGGYNGGAGSNCGELVFYGRAATDVPSAPSEAPAIRFWAVMNRTATFQLSNVAQDASVVEIQRKYGAETVWTACTTEAMGADEVSVRGVPEGGAASFRLRYINAGGASAWTEVTFETVPYSLTGTPIGPSSDWTGSGGAGDNQIKWHFSPRGAFDGTFREVFYHSKGTSNCWAGLDFGAPHWVTGVRYLSLLDAYGTTAQGHIVQVANMPDFIDAQTMGTTATGVTNEVQTLTFATPMFCRYARIITDTPQNIGFSEIEFETSACVDVPAQPAVAMDNVTNQYPILTWATETGNGMQDVFQAVPPVDQAVAPDAVVNVFRAEAPGGPWTAIGSATTGTYTDDTAQIGMPYWYRLGYGAANDPLTQSVRYQRATRLERDWNDLSRVKDGMAIIAKGDYWTSATNMFDGNIASFPDGHNGTLIGVDLGTNYVLSFARAHPRYNDGTYSTWNAYGRLHNTFLYGTTNANWSALTNPLTPAVVCTSPTGWVTVYALRETAARYVVMGNPNNEWYGNCTELELYGWLESATSGLLRAPEQIVTLTHATSIELGWEACARAHAYQIERRDGSFTDVWTTVGTVTGTGWTDTDVVAGMAYAYRVMAINGDETATSDEVTVAATTPSLGGDWLASQAYGQEAGPVVNSVTEGWVSLTSIGGGDMDVTGNQGFNLWQERTGAFDMSFRFELSAGAYTNGGLQQVALMVRGGIGEGAPFAAATVKWERFAMPFAGVRSRSADGGTIQESSWTPLGETSMTGCLLVRRVGNSVRCFVKTVDAEDWMSLGAVGLQDQALGSTVLVGPVKACRFAREKNPFTVTISQVKVESVPLGTMVIFR